MQAQAERERRRVSSWAIKAADRGEIRRGCEHLCQ